MSEQVLTPKGLDMLTRRGFLGVVGAGLSSSALRANAKAVRRRPSSAKASEGKPNFLFILTDDQRFDAMGCAGNRLVRTPHIDALAARGVRFDNAFVTLSICSPSRAACLTGRYGSANGVTTLGQTVNKRSRTFAQILKQAGYRTGMAGKWHLKNTPESLGFDFASYFTSNGPQYNRKAIEAGQKTTARGYVEDYNADQSIRFLTEAATSDEPFVLFHCTQVPHMTPQFDWTAKEKMLATYDQSKMPVPETWRDDLSGKPPYLKAARSQTKARTYGYDKKEGIQRHCRNYYASITEMDATLGRVLAALDKLGLRENTWVLLMGDNGWFMGEHGFTSKVLPYEESIRVPMIVAGPGTSARADKHLVLNVDLAPTMLDLAGVSVPASMQGRSLVPLLKGDKTDWRTSFLYEAPTPSLGSWPLAAIRSERWKYIQTFDIKDRTKLAFEELYDLKADPTEMHNLAGDAKHVTLQRQLADELDRHRRAIGQASGNKE
jgi:arylsulfatase A-like enzyme